MVYGSIADIMMRKKVDQRTKTLGASSRTYTVTQHRAS